MPPHDPAGAPSGRDSGERVRLIRDAVVNYGGMLLSAVVGFALVPLLVGGLGAESYGLLISAAALATLVGSFDLGLSATFVREVAADSVDPRDDLPQLAAFAAAGHLLLGIAGGGIVFLLGASATRGLRLSAETQALASIVFAAAAVGSIGDQMVAYALNVLRGRRRFDLVNLIGVLSALLRAAGLGAILLLAPSLLAVAVWQAVAVLTTALLALLVVRRTAASLRFRLGRFRWRSVRRHLSFGLASQLTNLAMRALWEAPVLLLGLARGSAAVVPFHVGSKFPLALSQVSWCAAETLFPAASERERALDRAGILRALQVVMRWIAVVVLPAGLILWCIAPSLLHVWLPQVPAEAPTVLRWMVFGVVSDALGVSPMYVLWGQGGARPVAAVLSATALLSLGIASSLLSAGGALAVAAGLSLSLAAAALVFLRLAAAACGSSAIAIVAAVARGLPLPLLVCAATLLGLAQLGAPVRWLSLVATTAAAALSYAVTLYFTGAREEERALVRRVLRVAWTLAFTERRWNPQRLRAEGKQGL